MAKRTFIGLMAMVLFFGLVSTSSAYSIRDDATGGDCTQIGIWDAATKTCTLTGDLNNLTTGITIDSDGITLDGDGHTFSGMGASSGVELSGRTGVVVKNLDFQNFWAAILLSFSSGNTISDVTTADGGYLGIGLYSSNNNTLTRNNIQNNYNGIQFIYSKGNTIYNNNITMNLCGIHFYNSGGNIVFSNNFFINQPYQAYICRTTADIVPSFR